MDGSHSLLFRSDSSGTQLGQAMTSETMLVSQWISGRLVPKLGGWVQPRYRRDHLVGAGEQRLRHGEAERFDGLEVDDQLVLGGRRHRGHARGDEPGIGCYARTTSSRGA